METLGQFLNRRREEISRTEGYLPTGLIPWRILAERTSIPENNLLRWSKDSGHPSSFEYVYALAVAFGPEVFPILGIDIDGSLAYLWMHRHDPNIQAIINEAHQKAKQKRPALEVTARPEQAPAYNSAR